MDRLRHLAALLAVATLALAPTACSDDGGDSGDTGEDPDPSVWLVGTMGAMVQLDPEGNSAGYPLETSRDLVAIACHGEATAWVASEGRSVLHTIDAGDTWTTLEHGLIDAQGGLSEWHADGDWTALAVAPASSEGQERVWVVGSWGGVALSRAGGSEWASTLVGQVSFTGVATYGQGSLAVAVGDDGSLWQLEAVGDGIEAVPGAIATSTGLSAVSMAVDGSFTVAVGLGGTVRTSDDLGLSWETLSLGQTPDLFAVQVASDGSGAFAVGESGALLRLSHGGAAPVMTAIPGVDADLYGVHLNSHGQGYAVGDAGTVVFTADGASTWTSLEPPTAANLRGVDDFHGGGHL